MQQIPLSWRYLVVISDKSSRSSWFCEIVWIRDEILERSLNLISAIKQLFHHVDIGGLRRQVRHQGTHNLSRHDDDDGVSTPRSALRQHVRPLASTTNPTLSRFHSSIDQVHLRSAFVATSRIRSHRVPRRVAYTLNRARTQRPFHMTHISAAGKTFLYTDIAQDLSLNPERLFSGNIL